MKVNSLAFRLFATAAGWSLIVLPLAAIIISSLFRQDEQAAFDKRVRLLLTLIVADSLEKTSTDHAGRPIPGQPSGTGEPQFEFLHSGWYWQIKPLGPRPIDRGPKPTTRGQPTAAQAALGAQPGKAGARIVSGSLASEVLVVPSDRKHPSRQDNFVWADLEGPVGETLRVAELVQELGAEGKERRYSYAVAGPMDEVNTAVSNLRNRLFVTLALAGLGLMAVTLFQVRFGLLPLRAIERGLAKIRSGNGLKLEGSFPAEIEPLQHELNALIQSNQDIIERARTQVGNLAHALKTPLAVITNEACDSKTPFARKVAEQAGIMRDQVSLYLDRARMAASVGVIGRKTEVKPVLEALARVLTRLHDRKGHSDIDAGKTGVSFSVTCSEQFSFQGEKQDLEEAMGNLMDNAGKWAKTQVAVSVIKTRKDPTGRQQLRIRVEDDGRGLTAHQCSQALERGRRLDETVPGSGLGLSIVADLAQSYHGRIELGRADLGGLRTDLYLPAV